MTDAEKNYVAGVVVGVRFILNIIDPGIKNVDHKLAGYVHSLHGYMNCLDEVVGTYNPRGPHL